MSRRFGVPVPDPQSQVRPDDFPMPTCLECGREFDLNDETDTEEYAYGHDCEVGDETAMARLGELLASTMPPENDEDECGMNLEESNG